MPGEFPTRPTDAVVREILEHIRRTGQPHKWRGHSHTRPEKGATVVYLEEFDLPSSHKPYALRAPCPICRPNHPKYYRDGKIAWFPDEGEIRMIGGDCYAKLVGHEQHQAALAQLRREQQERKDAAFVLSQIPRIIEALEIVDENVALARAVDQFRGRLLPRMGHHIHGQLWSHVRASGELRTTVEVIDRKITNGREVERRTEQEKRYASLPGYMILRPPPNEPLGTRMAADADMVRDLLYGDNPIGELSGDERSRGIKRLTRYWDRLRTLSAEVHGLQRFVDVVTVRTLRTWAARVDAPVNAYFDIKEGAFFVGARQDAAQSIMIPDVMKAQVREIPGLVGTATPESAEITAEVTPENLGVEESQHSN